jgi:transposase-like protein
MKAGQWSNEQIVATLQEATRGEKTITTLCKDKGISEATFYTWRLAQRAPGSVASISAKCNDCGSWRKRMHA